MARHGRRKLEAATLAHILADLADDIPPATIARRYGISRGTVYHYRANPPETLGPLPAPGETVADSPARCETCGGRLAVIPCRLCNPRPLGLQ